MTTLQIAAIPLVASGILPLLFRRAFWLRIICILFILFGTAVACFGIIGSHRTAMNQLEAAQKPWNDAVRDGVGYTHSAAMSTVPIFLLAVGALTALAIVPAKPKESDNDESRNA